MHPVFSRYLDANAIRATLERADKGEPLEDAERRLVEAAKAHPAEAELITTVKGRGSPDAQQAVLMLAATAAALALGQDPRLGGRVVIARSTLLQEGASEGEVMQFLASLVLEEAFGEVDDEEESVDTFDVAFVEDSLGEIPALARLTRDQVEQLVRTFERTAKPGWGRAYGLAAQSLVETAWMEGPQAVNHEHVHEALAHLDDELGDSDRAKAGPALRAFIAQLNDAGLVGKARKTRLESVLDRALSVPPSGLPS